MTAELRLRPEAERDLAEAAGWYEAQRPGLGQEFLDEVLGTLSSIAESPSLYPLIRGLTRRALIRRFPFGIFYQGDTRRVVVIAVMHAKRDPRRWRRRR